MKVDPVLAKLDLNTRIRLREIYNDNIFLTQSNREYDFITIISPSIGLRYYHRSIDLTLDYGLDFKFYSHHNELNETGLKNTQTLRLRSEFRPLNKIFIEISDIYRRVPIDIRRRIAFENIFVDMTDSNVFLISPRFEYPLSRTLNTKFGYRFTDIWYEAEEGNDSDSHLTFFTMERRLTPHLMFFLKYNYLIQKTEFTEDYDRHQGSVSIVYKKDSDITMQSEFGKAFFDYSGIEDKTMNFWYVSTDYRLRFLRKITVGASYDTSFYDSVTEGVYKSRRLAFHLTTGKHLKLNIRSYYTVDKYLEEERKDKVTGIAIDLSRLLTRKIESSIRFLCERQRFLPEDERVHRYSVDSRFEYKFGRRLSGGIGYIYNNKNSDIDVNDFHNNIVWIQANFIY
jgi:hypothetical protein